MHEILGFAVPAIPPVYVSRLTPPPPFPIYGVMDNAWRHIGPEGQMSRELSAYVRAHDHYVQVTVKMEAERDLFRSTPYNLQTAVALRESVRLLRIALQDVIKSFRTLFPEDQMSPQVAALKDHLEVARGQARDLLTGTFEKQINDDYVKDPTLAIASASSLARAQEATSQDIRNWAGFVTPREPPQPAYGRSPGDPKTGDRYSPHGTPPEGPSLSPFGSNPAPFADRPWPGMPPVYGYSQGVVPMPPSGWPSGPPPTGLYQQAPAPTSPQEALQWQPWQHTRPASSTSLTPQKHPQMDGSLAGQGSTEEIALAHHNPKKRSSRLGGRLWLQG